MLSNNTILQDSFFNQPTLRVAEALIGKLLVHSHGGKTESGFIAEVEAYDGFDDQASHAHRGRTERNAVMFGPAGYWYVYRVYGMHWMLNIVTGRENFPAAVLVRGIRMRDGTHYDGPGKLTRAYGITDTYNKTQATPASSLWIEDHGMIVPKRAIRKTPRIGVDYAGPVWSQKPYRFVIDDTFVFPEIRIY